MLVKQTKSYTVSFKEVDRRKRREPVLLTRKPSKTADCMLKYENSENINAEIGDWMRSEYSFGSKDQTRLVEIGMDERKQKKI